MLFLMKCLYSIQSARAYLYLSNLEQQLRRSLLLIVKKTGSWLNVSTYSAYAETSFVVSLEKLLKTLVHCLMSCKIVENICPSSVLMTDCLEKLVKIVKAVVSSLSWKQSVICFEDNHHLSLLETTSVIYLGNSYPLFLRHVS